MLQWKNNCIKSSLIWYIDGAGTENTVSAYNHVVSAWSIALTV